MSKKNKKKVRWIKLYNSDQKIFLVGEGDSFSACLPGAFGSGLTMVVTSLHSQDNQLSKNDQDEADLAAFRYLVIQNSHKSKPHGWQESAKYRKPKRRAVQYEVGDFVRAVLTKDRLPLSEYKKFAGRTIGPFEIVHKLDCNTYLLNLPSHIPTSNVFIRKHLCPYRGDRYYEPPLTINSFQRGEDVADLIACRYLDWFESQVEKYK